MPYLYRLKYFDRAIQMYHQPRNRVRRYRAVLQYTLHIEQPSLT